MTVNLPHSRSGKTAADVARMCAREAARIMVDGFGRTQALESKGRGNIVTAVDLAVEQATIDILTAEYPDHGIMSEETRADLRGDGWLWVVDPIDGTRNYASGIPHFCYNLALCYSSEPVLALTYDPLRQDEFFAVKGGGAFLNDRQLQASTKENVRAAVFGFEMGYKDALGNQMLTLVNHLWPGMQCLRIIGSAALGLAYAAAGLFDIFVHLDLSPWDVAPGVLLVEEAGGAITGFDGTLVSIYSRQFVAGGQQVHADFLRLVADWPWPER